MSEWRDSEWAWERRGVLELNLPGRHYRGFGFDVVIAYRIQVNGGLQYVEWSGACALSSQEEAPVDWDGGERRPGLECDSLVRRGGWKKGRSGESVRAFADGREGEVGEAGRNYVGGQGVVMAEDSDLR